MTVLYGQIMAMSSPSPQAVVAAPACSVAIANRRALFGALACAALLAGCAPNLGPLPSLSKPQSYAADASLAAPSTDWPSDDWWSIYGDPQLNALMAEALKGAPDLRIAQARVRQAEAQSEQAGAYRLPHLSANGAEYEARIGQSIGLPPEFANALPSGFGGMTQVGASLTYQLDFFGRYRAALAAATSSAEAQRADRASARLQLTTAVATAYANFVRLTEDRETAANSVKVRQATLQLVADRQHNGLETRGEFSQQNATVSSAKAEVEALDLQVLQTRHQIAALLGEGPDRGLQIERSPNAGALLHPFGLPPSLALNLVGRRPDIVAARLRAEAARQRMKSAKADFYPNVDLSASVIAASLGDKSLLQHNVNFTRIGPAVTLPIFSGGQLEGAYRGARGEYDQAAATYDQTLSTALREVADAIASVRSVQVQLTDARASLAADEDAYNVAKLRYQGGLSPYLNVLTAENIVLQQRQTVVNIAVQSLLSDIDLVRALGGGYSEPTTSGHPTSTR